MLVNCWSIFLGKSLSRVQGASLLKRIDIYYIFVTSRIERNIFKCAVKNYTKRYRKKKENQNLISQVSYFTLDPKSLNFQKSLLRYHSVYITLINIARTNLLSETRKEHFFPSFPIMAQLFINRTHLKRKRHRILSAHDSFERTFD